MDLDYNDVKGNEINNLIEFIKLSYNMMYWQNIEMD